jgi:CBS domain-containing protein
MLRVSDAMTQDVVTVRASASLRVVGQLLIENDISGLPVVDGRRVVGVVSEWDLLAKVHGRDAVTRGPFGWIFGNPARRSERRATVAASTAGDAMTTPAIAIAPERPIVEAAATISRHRIKRLPVIVGHELVGIISRRDLVRAFMSSDDELAALVREAVMYQTLWLDPAAFNVAVTDGRVRVHGRVERRSTAALIERLPSLIPGVTRVEANVQWEIDDQPAPGG